MTSGVGTATSGVIALLTDFGTSDGYVGIMKGVILGIHPKARLVDLTHEIQPQDVREAAFVLHTAHRYFPARTVHLAVVDPGVGTSRVGVVLDTGDALFVAPDNGILTYLLAQGRSLPTREGTLRDLNQLVPAPDTAGVEGGKHHRSQLLAAFPQQNLPREGYLRPGGCPPLQGPTRG